MADLTGSRLGPYDLTRKLGQGGMGAVYVGVHRVLQTPRAIKVLLPTEADDAVIERFVREGVISASLRHPNIVEIFDVGEDDGSHYLVMEMVEGQSLHQHLRDTGAMPPERVVRLLRHVADALDYAHARGVVHRDVKPSNIIVEPDDGVTLIDFGIARALDESRLTRVGVVVGTFEYMAPEVVTQGGGSPGADRYALGIVAYQMLTGRVPFSGESAHSVMYRQVHDPPPPPTQFRPGLPAAVEEALLRQLAKSPDDRFPTSQAFVDALDAALQAFETGVPTADHSILTGRGPAFERPTPGSGQTPFPRSGRATRPAAAATLTPPAARALPASPPIPSPPTGPRTGTSATTVGLGAAHPSQTDPVTGVGATPSVAAGRRTGPVVGVLVGIIAVLAVLAGTVYFVPSLRDAVLGQPLDAPATTTVAEPPAAPARQPRQAAAPAATTTAPAAQQPQPAPTAASLPTAVPPTPLPTALPKSPPTAAVPPTLTPARRVEQARDASAQGRHAEALIMVDDLRAAAPDTPGLDDAAFDIHLAYAKALFERGEVDASDAQFAAALRLRPSDAAARDGQRQVLLSKQYAAMELAWGRNDEAAIAALTEIMAVDPEYRETRQKLYALLIAKADRQTGAGERDAAFDTLTQALGVLPEAGEAQQRLAAYTPTPVPTQPAPAYVPQQSAPAPARQPAPAPARQPAPAPAPAPAPSNPSCPGGVCP